LGGPVTGKPLHAEVGQTDTTVLFLDEGQPLQAHDRDIARTPASTVKTRAM